MPRASKIAGGASQKMDADLAAGEQSASLNPANASSTSAPRGRASQMGGGLTTASQKTAAEGDTTEQNAVDLNPNAADDQQQPASSAKITGSAGSNAATSAKITGSAGSNAAASAKVAGSTGSNAAASTKMGSGSTNEQSPLVVNAGGGGAYGYGYATTQQNGQPFDATNAAAGGDGTSQMGSSLKDYWERYMVLWIVIICILAAGIILSIVICIVTCGRGANTSGPAGQEQGGEGNGPQQQTAQPAAFLMLAPF
ncbi:unnamed protein product [Amoebophrya sp. A120]|nr:unnamed protein product [Amoebophrya sp. A120]|eukprot:GSA120T00012557001.1